MIPHAWFKFEEVAANNGALSKRAKDSLEVMLILVNTCILKSTGDASSEDPVDPEKEKKYKSMKRHIETAQADQTGILLNTLDLKF